MLPVVAPLLSCALAVLAALHIYGALRGDVMSRAVVPTRSVMAGGQRVFMPGRGATLAVAGLLGVAALVPLAAAGVIALPLPAVVVRTGIWGVAAVLFARSVGDFRYVGLAKRVWGTRFASLDTRVYTPLCIILSALALIVAVGSS